mgnify:FL=1
MTIQQALLNYFDEFEAIERHGEDKYVSLEWLGGDIIFGITTNPDVMGGIVMTDVVGNVTKGHSFMFSAYFPYTKDKLQMIENSAFFEELMYWVAKNNKNKILPEFDDGRQSLKLELLQTPYLFMVDNDNQQAQYTVTYRLIYKERKV